MRKSDLNFEDSNLTSHFVVAINIHSCCVCGNFNVLLFKRIPKLHFRFQNTLRWTQKFDFEIFVKKHFYLIRYSIELEISFEHNKSLNKALHNVDVNGSTTTWILRLVIKMDTI